MRRRWMTVVAIGVALAIGFPGGEAAARKRRPKNIVTATIDGQRRKWKPKNVTVQVVSGSVNVVATILRPRLNQFIPGVALSCQLDLASTFPVTPAFPQICVVGYTEFRARVPIVTKMWGGSNFDGGVTVTFESLQGTRLTGGFQGMLTSQDTPANPPVAIDGRFSVDVGG